MGNYDTGRATFERIWRDIESGMVQWLLRDVDHAPYRLRAGRQYGAEDGEDEDGGERDRQAASTWRVRPHSVA